MLSKAGMPLERDGMKSAIKQLHGEIDFCNTPAMLQKFRIFLF